MILPLNMAKAHAEAIPKSFYGLRISEHLFPSGVAHTAVCRQAVAPLEPLHGGSGGRTVLAVIFQPLAQRIELLLYQPHRAAGRARCAATMPG